MDTVDIGAACSMLCASVKLEPPRMPPTCVAPIIGWQKNNQLSSPTSRLLILNCQIQQDLSLPHKARMKQSCVGRLGTVTRNLIYYCHKETLVQPHMAGLTHTSESLQHTTMTVCIDIWPMYSHSSVSTIDRGMGVGPSYVHWKLLNVLFCISGEVFCNVFCNAFWNLYFQLTIHDKNVIEIHNTIKMHLKYSNRTQ